MKKFLTAILAILYFATSNGATIHLHYCMDKLVDKSIWHNDKDQCSKCGMAKTQQNKNCCNDEVKQVKLGSDHYASNFTFEFLQIAALVQPLNYNHFRVFEISSISEENPSSNDPPRSCGATICKLNCIFRI